MALSRSGRSRVTTATWVDGVDRHGRGPWRTNVGSDAHERACRRTAPPSRTSCSRTARSRRPRTSRSASLVAGTFLYDEADEDYQGFWARQAAELARLVRGVAHDLRLAAAVRQVVRRRQAQRLPQRRRPPRRGRPRRQGRVPLGGRARRHPHDHLRRPPPRGAAVRQRPEVARRREGRPGRHLHADGPRAARRHARLRPHRRAALASCSAASAPTRSSTASTTPSARCVITADGGFRRGAPSMLKPNVDAAARVDARASSTSSSSSGSTSPSRWSRAATTGGTTSSSRPTPSARASRWTARTCSTCSTRRARRRSPRASCTRPAATSPRSRSRTSTSSTSIPTTTSTGARPTSAGSPATATSSTGRSRTAPRR